jgi:hypothetical protein
MDLCCWKVEEQKIFIYGSCQPIFNIYIYNEPWNSWKCQYEISVYIYAYKLGIYIFIYVFYSQVFKYTNYTSYESIYGSCEFTLDIYV